MVAAAIDIECVSACRGFPDASQENDICKMVGAVYWRLGHEASTAVKCAYVAGTCNDIEDGHIYRYDDEKSMLSGFRSSLVCDVDPDIIVTYNGFGFDYEYMIKRSEMLGNHDFCFLDRMIVSKSMHGMKELSSSALGSNELYLIHMIGRSNLDIFQWVKAIEKLQSYKLDDVANKFLGENKIDMDYKEMFDMCMGNDEQVAKVAEYCIQDCFLLVRLIQRLQIIDSKHRDESVTYTPLEALVTRGQQFKVLNQALHYGHRVNRRSDGSGHFILNTPERYSGGPDDSYEGATVIDAKASFYTEPIAVLDFMSLYPSIMMANNLCFSNIVLNPKYMNLPGVKYETITVTEKKFILGQKE